MAHLGVQAAEALEHAHSKGIVHRDIKPANLLIEVGGDLWITDFGLAHCKNQAGLTMSGDLVGTLRYMSPEQALAKRVVVDHRTDVYSLGATLYELLTLEHAFDGHDRQELLRQIAFEEPRPPRRRNKSIPAELETIILKAMEKDPIQRYGSAEELADDLKHWLAGEPIQARRANTWQRAVKWVRRRPAVAAFLAASGVAVLALLGLGVGLAINGRLQLAVDEANRFRYFQHMTLAGRDWQDNKIGRLAQLLEDCPPDYRHHWEWQYLKRQCQGELLTLEGHRRPVWHLVFSPDGKRLATSDLDGKVKLWDVATGREERTLNGHNGWVFRVAFSPDGERLASAGGDGTVRLWAAATGLNMQEIQVHDGPVGVRGLAFSPDGTRLASSSTDGTVKVWDVALGREVQKLEGHKGPTHSVAFSPDGKWLASTGTGDTVKIYDAATGRKTSSLPHTSVNFVAFSPDGTRLASAGDALTVKIWDVAAWREVMSLPTSGFHCVAFSPDGKRLATCGEVAKVWDLATGLEIRRLSGHANVVHAVAFSPDGTRLASASQDMTVKFWDPTTNAEERILRGHSGPVGSVAFSPDGERLASVGMDGAVKVWHAATGQEEYTLQGPKATLLGGVIAVAFSADGTQLASAGGGKAVKVWNVKTGQWIRDLPHAGDVESVAFSLDGKWLASGDADGTLKVWQAATLREVDGFNSHDHQVRSLAFSPDGSRLASAGSDMTVKIWDVATRRPIRTLEPRQFCWIYSVAFSPDGTQLASASGDGNLQIWNAITGEHIRSIQGHGNYVRSVAFSRDGTRLVSAARFIRFWDVGTGQEVLIFERRGDGVLGVTFSRDGNRLAAASQDGTVKVWDSRPLTPQIAVEREALALLHFLFARPLAKTDVVAFLSESQTIRREVRQQAMEWAAQYHEEQDSKRYHRASWDVVRQPYLNAFQYRFALRQAETACRLVPKEGSYQTTLGVAQYRAGRFQDALATLTRPQQRSQVSPTDLAFLAMTQCRLGQKEQAQATLTRLRQAMEESRWSQDSEMHGFAREAEALIQSR